MSAFAEAMHAAAHCDPVAICGSVTTMRGMTLYAADLPVQVGARVDIETAAGVRPAEVVGFDDRQAVVMLLDSAAGVRPGDPVRLRQDAPTVQVGPALLGRVVDGLGRPIDGGEQPRQTSARPTSPTPLGAMSRRRIREPLQTGVRVIDLMTTVGQGQRLGIFAGPGVGKSTLLGMLARGTSADVSVIALIGERGREVREFIEDSLGTEGLARSVVVVSTSDEAPLMRIRAAATACAAAEYFRDQGQSVLLMIDSITRYAHAQRQIGLAAGEPPATRGYTPSVFAMLPTLLERAGPVEGGGSITGVYTILVEGDDMTEPIADAARGILDGHVILSRRLAQQGRFPAVDVLDSISRVANDICSADHAEARRTIGRLLAAYRDAEDLIQIGAYSSGADALTDVAIEMRPRLMALLEQRVDECASFEDSRQALLALASEAEARLRAATTRRHQGGQGASG
ncbi:MAG: FliI/YscN family ATPase [Phycisphaerales bacterium]|nr:FliI/YscN family ATPase [Phycisphaerales bacterium]